MKKNKKKYFIILLVVFSIIRYFISYNIPSFYLQNLRYDDALMIKELGYLYNGDYLGPYSSFTLIKGIIFPIILEYSKFLSISYSSIFTILYICSCLYFIFSISRIIKSKKVLLILYLVLLFNPVTFSSELFQRLYINTISITELLFFLGSIINFAYSKNNILLHSIVLGAISSLMLLSRNDNIWIYIIITLLIIYRLFKSEKIKIKNLFTYVTPFIIIIISLNLISFVNYSHYNVYSYNELENSYFKDAYNKVRQIETNESYDNVTITKNMFYELCDNSKVFNISKEVIDSCYNDKHIKKTSDGQIDNGNMIWLFRSLIYNNEKFKNGREANDYFKKLSEELDDLFEKGKLKKKSGFSSVFINVPNKNEIKKIPKSLIEAIIYTTTYKNVKTYSKKDLEVNSKKYDKKNRAYSFEYYDYRNAENMIKNNEIKCEIIRIIYKSFSIVFSIIAILIYIKNLRVKDNLNLFIHIVVLIYIMILFGVVYTHVSAFHAIRYRYLSNIYILQNLFIVLNLSRLITNKKVGMNDDISSNTGIQRRKINKKNTRGNKKSIKKQ